MLNRLAWRIQPIEHIRKRQQRKRDMWQRHEHSVGHVANQKSNILHLWRPVGGWSEEDG